MRALFLWMFFGLVLHASSIRTETREDSPLYWVKYYWNRIPAEGQAIFGVYGIVYTTALLTVVFGHRLGYHFD